MITDQQIRDLLEHVGRTPGIGASDRVLRDCRIALAKVIELDSSDIAVGADAFLERGAQVLDGITFVGEHEDRFASDGVLEVWKDIASIEAGPVGNGRGIRISTILRSHRYLDPGRTRSSGIVLPSHRVFVTPAIPISRVLPVICQWRADAMSATLDPTGIAYQRAVARRDGRDDRWLDMRVNHVSISSRGELELGLRGVVADGIVIDEVQEIVLAGDIIETGDR